MTRTLRPYQNQAIDEVRAKFLQGIKRVVLCLPTGAGKSLIFSTIAQKASENGSNVVILTHRIELKTQAEGYGSGVTVIMVETFNNMIKKQGAGEVLAPFNLVIIDEAHIGNFRKIVQQLPKKTYLIGATATPISKPRMAVEYQEIVCPVSISDLVASGYLAKPTTCVSKVVSEQDCKALETQRGEFTTASLEALYLQAKVMDGVVKQFVERKGYEKKSIIFCSSIKTSEALASELEALGNCQVFCIHSKMPSKVRAGVIAEFSGTPRNATLVNCGIATTGFDVPDIEIVIVNRATLSLPLWLQMCGRGSRVLPGKTSFEIWDFGNNVARLGHWEQKLNWRQLFFDPERTRKTVGMKASKQCPECAAFLAPSVRSCKYCGYEYQAKVNEILDGVLEVVEYQDIERLEGRDLFSLSIKELAELIAYKKYKKFFFEAVLYSANRMPELEAYWKQRGYKWGAIRHRKEWLNKIKLKNVKVKI
jgi:superfamily II DNA or RNA helicase